MMRSKSFIIVIVLLIAGAVGASIYFHDQLQKVQSDILSLSDKPNNSIDSTSPIKIDYAGGQNASATSKGFLTALDWMTFNNKADSSDLLKFSYKIDRSDLSTTTSGLTYSSTTGIFSVAPGYVIPTTTEETSWNSVSSNNHVAVTLGDSNGLSLSTQQLSLGLAANGVTGALSGTDWNTFNGKQVALVFGNLTAGSNKLSLGGTGTGAVIGAGLSLDVAEGNLNHNNLSGLTTGDPHTQYTLLAGRSGGQSLIGGTDANDDITIQGTTNVTKTDSFVMLQPDGGKVGIGTATPGATLDVNGTVYMKGPWADVRAYGAKGDGTTDDTAAVQAALSASLNVYFPTGIYIVSNLTTQNNQKIFGDGKSSTLKFKTGSAGYMIEGGGNVLCFNNLDIDGGNTVSYAGTASAGTRSFVHLDLTLDNQSVISGVSIHGFNNIAIGYNGSGNPIHDAVVISNSFISNNFIGIDTAPSGVNHDVGVSNGAGGEYSKITGNTLNNNRYAIVIDSGNTSVTGNNLSSNGYAFYIGGGGNQGHGTISGNLANHSTVAAVYMTGIPYGFTISGNQFFYGDWFILNSDGITITNNTIAATNMTLSGNWLSFKNNWFYVSTNFTNTASNANWDSNYNRVTGSYINGTALIVDSNLSYSNSILTVAGGVSIGHTANMAPLTLTSGSLLTLPQTGAFEFNADDYYVTLSSTGGGPFSSYYPPTQDAAHVKATSYFNNTFMPYFATDPTKSLIGDWVNNSWVAPSTNRRFHIDLGATQVVTKIYYENEHISGGTTNDGAKNFTFWGSNSATSFGDVIYGDDTGWTQLTTSQSSFDQHVAQNTPDPKYITITNATPYRYYAVKIADNWGGSYMGLRRIELQGQGYKRVGMVLNDGTNLVSGRIPYATTNGRLTDSTNLLFNGNNLGIGVTSPTAVLHLKAATAAADTASLKIDAGVLATTPVSGNVESDGTHLYWTDSGGVRRQLDN